MLSVPTASLSHSRYVDALCPFAIQRWRWHFAPWPPSRLRDYALPNRTKMYMQRDGLVMLPETPCVQSTQHASDTPLGSDQVNSQTIQRPCVRLCQAWAGLVELDLGRGQAKHQSTVAHSDKTVGSDLRQPTSEFILDCQLSSCGTCVLVGGVVLLPRASVGNLLRTTVVMAMSQILFALV